MEVILHRPSKVVDCTKLLFRVAHLLDDPVMYLPQSGDVALPSTFPDRLEKSFELTIKLDVLLV